ADIEARDAVLLANALEVALRRLLRDRELECDRLDRLAAAVERHDAALLGAELGGSADLAGAEREVELCRDEAVSRCGGADRLDDHAGILALHEVAERARGDRLTHDV